MSPVKLDRQPTLRGPTLLLRPLTRDDFDALFAVASDPLIWEQHPAHDRWQKPVFEAFFEDALANGGALAVIEQSTDQMIGSSRYQFLEPENGGSVEIGWTFLARAFWGGPTNHEMKSLMIGHALAHIAECRFAVGETNWRSRKAMEKIGARLVEREATRAMAGSKQRHVFYVIGHAEYSAGPLA